MKNVLTLIATLLFSVASAPTLGLELQGNTEDRPTTKQPRDAGQSGAAREKRIDKTSKKHRRVTRKKKKRKRRCHTRANPRYRRMVRLWQRIPKIPKPRYREGFRDLTVYAINLSERARLFPFLPDGSIDPEAVTKLEHLFRDKDYGTKHHLHPRLIKLLYRLADRFKARQITLISGFREMIESEGKSNHARGRAADIVIPGVPLAVLARFARKLGHVGVGFYPSSGFVHLDVRNGPSYFWVDRSAPGKHSCLRRIQSKLAAKNDRRWRPKHDKPRRHVNRKGKPLGAIEKQPDPLPSSPDAGSSP